MSLWDKIEQGAGIITGKYGVDEMNTANAAISSARTVAEQQEAARARQFSKGMTREQNIFAAQEAAKQREFTGKWAGRASDQQWQMSNTAVTRRMMDMKRAGINPILAGKYDASTSAGAVPSGAAATGQSTPTAKGNAYGYTSQNPYGNVMQNISTGIQLYKILADADFIKAKTNSIAPIANVGKGVDALVEKGKQNFTKAINTGSAWSVMRESQSLGRDLKGYLREQFNKIKGNMKGKGYYINMKKDGKHEYYWNNKRIN